MHKNKLNFTKATEIFHDINNKEKEVREFNKRVNCYKVFCEVHEKIDENYKAIEKAIEIVENTDYSSILKKADDKSKEEGFGGDGGNSPSRIKAKTFRLEVKSIDVIGENENVLKGYKHFNILQNGNFSLENDDKGIIKGKFKGEKITMQKLGQGEDEQSLFFEGTLEGNKMKFVFDSDSSAVSDKFSQNDFMIEISLKLDMFRVLLNEGLACEAWISKGDELDNKLIRNGWSLKSNHVYLVLGDFTSKSFCRINMFNTEGSDEITGTSFNINESEKTIDIKS